MPILEALVLGIVQGLTEFLPVSSTAHLRVVPSLLGWGDPGATYSAVIQLGSVAALLVYFARDIFSIGSGFTTAIAAKNLTDPNVRLVGGIILGTVPIGILGLSLRKLIEADNGPFRSLAVIAIASIVMASLLLVAEKLGKRARTLNDLGVRDGLLVGLCQALALIPGCSRSGSTLTGALLLHLNREDAARFSFLLGIPAVVLSGLLELKKLLGAGGLSAEGSSALAAGLIASTLVSYAAIWWLLKFLRTHSTAVFVGYRYCFGALVLILLLNGKIH